MNNNVFKRSIAVFAVLLLLTPIIQARQIVDKSDNIRPHWMERTDDIYRYNYSYEYKCILNEGRNLQSLIDNRLINFALFMQQTNKIDGTVDRNVLSTNVNGEMNTHTIYKIAYKTQTSIEEFDCIYIDMYWELDSNGIYHLYTLFAVSIYGITPQFDTYTLSTHYKPSEGLARSFVPGWGQIYKGSKTKGGLIIAGEALGVGGIVTCYSMKASYEKLMQEDPKHIKDYSMSADMWQNIGYGCIAFTAAIYIYNLIDAAVAPGSRRVIVYPRDNSISIAPSITKDGSVGFAMKLNF